MPCHSDGRGSGPAADPVRPRTRSGRGPGPAADPVRPRARSGPPGAWRARTVTHRVQADGLASVRSWPATQN